MKKLIKSFFSGICKLTIIFVILLVLFIAFWFFIELSDKEYVIKTKTIKGYNDKNYTFTVKRQSGDFYNVKLNNVSEIYHEHSLWNYLKSDIIPEAVVDIYNDDDTDIHSILLFIYAENRQALFVTAQDPYISSNGNVYYLFDMSDINSAAIYPDCEKLKEILVNFINSKDYDDIDKAGYSLEQLVFFSENMETNI